MPNPFSSKAGKNGEPKKNPFSVKVAPQEPKRSPFAVKAGLTNGAAPKQSNPRNRTTAKERAAAVRAAEKAKGGRRSIANPSNPWVRTAYDVSAQLKELDEQIQNYQKQYDQQLKLQKKAKEPDEIESAFNRGDTLMSAIIGLSARRRRLAGGAVT